MKAIREKLNVKGWMLKMAGSGIGSRTNSTVEGKYGTYLIKEKIGKGGNGAVYAAEIINGGDDFSYKKGYAIKFLDVLQKDGHEMKKRVQRFIKEIKQVLLFQGDVAGIIPIFDTSIFLDDSKELWYLMPKAEKYKLEDFNFQEKIKQMIDIGDSIKQLHERGYAHRDIKPKNLLILENRLCLSDFGLIWNVEDSGDHITEVNDRLGPLSIRPPELQMIEDVDGVDYRKSDVYLYSKTIWMVLQDDYSNGFPAEYSRNNPSVYINKENFAVETAEPLHRLMEQSTKDKYWERMDIDSCIRHLEEQLGVIRGEIPLSTLSGWKYIEQAKHDRLSIPPDEQLYRDPSSILKILNNMVGTVGLVFMEAGKEYNILPLKKVKQIQGNMFELEILNPYCAGRKKIVELALDHISLTKDMSYLIQSTRHTVAGNTTPTFDQLLKALQAPNKRVRLSACYSIQLAVK